MKICPNCQTRYTDDSLKFCLQDGTPLVTELEEISAPDTKSSEYETVVKPRPSDTGYTTNKSYVQPEERSNTFKIVALTVLTMFVLLGGISAGAWFYFNSGKREIAQNNNAVKNTKTITKNTPETNKTENIANNSETPTPTPEKTPEIDAGRIQKEISKTIDSWKNAAEDLNENNYMSFYADRLDYYNKKNASVDFVRKDKVKAFTPYDDVDMDISNLSVVVENDGETATAVFDKKWNFEGEDQTSNGKVQSELKFKKFDGKWKIISEKDLNVYYVNKE